MARSLDRNRLREGLRLRHRVMAATHAFALRDAAPAALELTAVAQGYRTLAAAIEGLPEAVAARRMAEASGIAAQLCQWTAAVLDASPDAQRHLQAAQAQALLLQDELPGLGRFPASMVALEQWSADAAAISAVSALPKLIHAIGSVPLPVFYSINKDPYAWIRPQGERSDAQETPAEPVVKVLFTLDGIAWANSQAIRSRVQYDLGAEIKVSAWPAGLPLLEVDYVTTMDASAYALTPLVLSQEDVEQGSGQRRGHLVFYVSQTLLSAPAVLKVRARFVSEDRESSRPATVIGHSELWVSALDEASYPVLTSYRMIDIQLPQLLQEARLALPDLPPSDLDDFTKCLVYLSRYAAMVQQTGYFKGRRVSEPRDFQQHLLQNLRMTDMGADVREAEHMAGGILDLRYRNIVIELKVEDHISDRTKLREKYVAQPTQYASSVIPLSITCILDMVEKDAPPANVANNITLETPPIHGFIDTAAAYPSKVAVVIIDGNLKSPSDYS